MTTFTRAFLLMFSGPIIWAAHFVAVYVLVALACARQFAQAAWLGIGLVSWGIALLTFAGVAGIVAIAARQYDGRSGQGEFERWITVTAAGLSILAIVWEAIPAVILPPCG
ncbi:MAG TPA: hypothetical protein VGE12_22030 [Noviherbaspirillum sp.]